MPSAWRIVTARRAATAFDGEGARLYGGRWNSPGLPAVYVAGSRALAALEMLVHLAGEEKGMIWRRYEVQFASKWVDKVDISDSHLQNALRAPVVTQATQVVGDRWLKSGKKPVLQVWSSIIPEEKNYLLNPRHPEFKRIQIETAETFVFDPRLE